MDIQFNEALPENLDKVSIETCEKLFRQGICAILKAGRLVGFEAEEKNNV